MQREGLAALLGREGLAALLGRIGVCMFCHADELNRPEGAVPADAFEATDGDEIAGIAEDAAQIGGEGGWHGQRKASGLVFEHDEANAVGRRRALGHDGPACRRRQLTYRQTPIRRVTSSERLKHRPRH
jgi:hypothetical protein